MPFPDLIQEAIEARRGARFMRCALHVNPFAYAEANGRGSSFPDERAYNEAVITACRDHGIEVIGVTDHYRIDASVGLLQAARSEGIVALPGFEAATRDGVHFLCLFDASTSSETIERYIGCCEVYAGNGESVLGALDAREFLEKARAWKAVTVAAHATNSKGILKGLTGQARVAAWQSPDLLAVAVPGSVDDLPQNYQQIIRNKNPQYRRDHPVAVVNARDVNAPDDLANDQSWSWVKMSSVGIEGLRQAFLDPESRVRLASDPDPHEHSELVAIAWEGGFLDGAWLHLNENLNVLIGGRGAGKSTVIESIRYVLDVEPLGQEARQVHRGIVQRVLTPGTRVSLVVRSPRPHPAAYVVQRTVPNPPVVLNGTTGTVLDLSPGDVMPHVEIYGQHEIAELGYQATRRAKLLDRFGPRDPYWEPRRASVGRSLARERARIVEALAEVEDLDERMAALPGLEERLRRFQRAEVEQRVQQQAQFATEHGLLQTVEERFASVERAVDGLTGLLPLDRAFLARSATEALPSADLIEGIDQALGTLSDELEKRAGAVRESVARARGRVAGSRGQWEARRHEVDAAYQRALRELGQDRVDGQELVAVRQALAQLRPLGEHRERLRIELKERQAKYEALLTEWESLQKEDFDRLEQAASQVSKRLAGLVRVQVNFRGDRTPLLDFLVERVGGRLDKVKKRLTEIEPVSPRELAQACRQGEEALAGSFDIAGAQARSLASSGEDVLMEMEALELPATAEIELNIGADGPVWRPLGELSTGQKATALLLLLLLESDRPLVIDQPEDDLDNSFIATAIVQRMRNEKLRRQFLFSTHNANIPVLGDAELIATLRAEGEPDGESMGRGTIEQVGSIDSPEVRALVEELLEGGRAAFETRRRKYGF